MASTPRDEISRLELLHAAHPDGLVFPHLAEAYRRAGRYPQAESVLRAGLERHGGYASAHVVLGRLRLDQGRPDDAAAAFRRVLALDPQNHIALQQLGQLAAGGGRPEEAARYARALQRLRPDGGAGAATAPASSSAASSTATSAGPGPALRSPSTPASPTPAQPTPPASTGRGTEPGEVVTETMAELYERQGLPERAVAVYQQLLSRAPDDARIARKLADAEAGLRRSRNAAEPASAEAASAEAAPTKWASAEAASAEPAPADAAERSGASTAASERGTVRAELRALLDWSAGAEPASAASGPPSKPRWSRPAPAPPRPPFTDATAVPPPGAAASPSDTAGSTPDRVAPPPDTAAPGATLGAAPRSYARDAAVQGAAPDAAPPDPDAAIPDADRPAKRVPLDNGLARFEGAEGHDRTLLALSDLLVGLLEYRDPYFRGSSSQTRLLATRVAEELGLSPESQLEVGLAAVLRDLGRLALGGRILPAGRHEPTGESVRRIERHVDLALHLLEGVDLPGSVRAGVRHHHERWDGAGYPGGLAGSTIPLTARILAVADSFTAMISPRSYRLPRKPAEAARELEAESGTRYDPEVVAALLRVLARRDQPHLGIVQRHHVLLTTPDQAGGVVTATRLCTAGFVAEVAPDPRTARERLRRVPVSAIVVSAATGEADACQFVQSLREDPAFEALPVVVIDAEGVPLRVRLLEVGADVCFPPGISHGELQGTLGALVRRVVRSRENGAVPTERESSWLALQGELEDFPLSWLLQAMKYDARTAAIALRVGGREGAIYLERGDAVHAAIRNGPVGELALRELLRWEGGHFRMKPDARPRDRTIHRSIMHLLLTHAVDEDRPMPEIFGAVSAGD